MEFGSAGSKERGKPEYPEKNLSEQGRQPTTNYVHVFEYSRIITNARKLSLDFATRERNGEDGLRILELSKIGLPCLLNLKDQCRT